MYCVAVATVLVPVGIAWRMAPLQLPWFWYKYGGSALWAAMVYWLTAAIWPKGRPLAVAAIAAAVAAGVEFSRLVHTPGLDAFRLTLAGKLILGRIFALRNVIAYWLAVAAAAGVDARWLKRPKSKPASTI